MLNPDQALHELLTFIEINQISDCRGFRSEDFANHLSRSQQALRRAPPEISPFARYRDTILSKYGTAIWLQALVMHLWNSQDYNLALNRIGGFDLRHRQIALEMIAFYAKHGENDRDFMKLADEVRGLSNAAVDADASDANAYRG